MTKNTVLQRARGRHTGLLTYLQSILSDVNEYTSAEDCEQNKLTAYKNIIVKNVEHLEAIHSEILLLIDPRPCPHVSGVARVIVLGGRVASAEGARHFRGVRGHGPPENFEM